MQSIVRQAIDLLLNLTDDSTWSVTSDDRWSVTSDDRARVTSDDKARVFFLLAECYKDSGQLTQAIHVIATQMMQLIWHYMYMHFAPQTLVF